MNTVNRIVKTALFVLLGLLPNAIAVAEERQPQSIPIQVIPGRMMQDLNGIPILFVESPTPVRVFLVANHEALQNQTVWTNVCEAYEIMILVDGKEVPPETFALSHQTILQKPLSWCVVEVVPSSGSWPTGGLIISGSLNPAALRQTEEFTVQLVGEDQPLRLVSRSMAGSDEERLRLRFDVARYATDEQCLAWEPDRALEAVEKLHARFPDDPYGHAYAGLLHEIHSRDPKLALSHYQKALGRITQTLPASVLEGDKPFNPTKEFLDLRFDAWMGAQGARELVRLLQDKIRRLETQLNPPPR